MKKLIAFLLAICALAFVTRSFAQTGPANVGEADRSDDGDVQVVSTPEPAPIPTKANAGDDVLDHKAPDQQLACPKR